MDRLIEVRGLHYRYPDGTAALNGVDFFLAEGERVALLGRNGSGKTTFALHLNGLLHGEGSVTVCGLPVDKHIAGVLVMEPEILVLDEPTTFLDPPAQGALISLLQELPQAKILITHDTAFARVLCTRAVFFEKGIIAGEGTVEELVERFRWNSGAGR